MQRDAKIAGRRRGWVISLQILHSTFTQSAGPLRERLCPRFLRTIHDSRQANLGGGEYTLDARRGGEGIDGARGGIRQDVGLCQEKERTGNKRPGHVANAQLATDLSPWPGQNQ